jgi:predicted enzyme related to lactoylglutathione lyase
MITSIHAMIYSDDPTATRTFLRDVLGWPNVAMHDDEMGGDNWLIFKSGPSELGVHPTSGEWEGHTYTHPKHHSISLMCDDIHSTIAELKAKGAEFVGEVQDHGYGLVAMMKVPGADNIQLYQPQHPVAYSL